MLRIQIRLEGPAYTTLSLSGRIQPEHVAELRALLEGEPRQVILDLKEVTLVCCEAVRFLGLCESSGIELRDCPAYVREWILRERPCGAGPRVPEKE
jgi:hypothetical protein